MWIGDGNVYSLHPRKVTSWSNGSRQENLMLSLDPVSVPHGGNWARPGWWDTISTQGGAKRGEENGLSTGYNDRWMARSWFVSGHVQWSSLHECYASILTALVIIPFIPGFWPTTKSISQENDLVIKLIFYGNFISKNIFLIPFTMCRFRPSKYGTHVNMRLL